LNLFYVQRGLRSDAAAEAVFAKLAVRSRAEAVSQGVRRGLVHL